MHLNHSWIATGIVCIVFFAPSFAFGWGETGHRVVCQIAYDELLPAARSELDRLIALDRDFDSFAESCLFADSPE
ncbi:MAG: S1/P1 nuclease, partial [Woeseiaceae bacterium]